MSLIITVIVFSMSISAFAEIGYEITPTKLYPTERLNLRSKPTINSSIIAVLDPTDSVTGQRIVEDNTGKIWVRVDTKNGSGYASYWSLAKEDKSEVENYHKVKKKLQKLKEDQEKKEK